MKVGQKTIVRWVSKLVATGAGRTGSKRSVDSLRELGADQLRHVSGGTGNSTQSPGKTW
jgi:hypothetical protein